MTYELISAIEKMAPTIATALTGPIGGVVTALVEHATGLSGDALTQAAITDPATQLKLKELEYKHAEELGKQSVQEEESARQLAAAQTGIMRYWLPLLTLINIFMLAGSLVAMKIVTDTDVDHALVYLSSVLTGTLYVAFRLWFGKKD